MRPEIVYEKGRPVGCEIHFDSEEEKEKFLKLYEHFLETYVIPVLEQLNENRKD